jgi:hypothetical protein
MESVNQGGWICDVTYEQTPYLMGERPTTEASSSIGLAATALEKAMPIPRRPSALWRAFTPSTI